MKTVLDKLAALRALMKANNLAAYVIPANDPHASEYMAPHWMETVWLTGFQGESATVVVTMDEALLFTDSRYYLQAEAELQGTTIQLMRASDVDCPTVNQWLADRYAKRFLVGVNPEMWSINEFSEFNKFNEFRVVSIDLIRELWTEGRPEIPTNPIYEYKEEYAGESVASKLKRVREAIQAKGANAIVISELDEIGWLLNIRGTDVDYTPCAIAYVVVEMERCTLFINPAKLTEDVREYLQRIGVETRGYEEVFEFLKTTSLKDRCAEGPATPVRFMMDGNRVNQRLYEAVGQENAIVVSPSPVQVMMSIKNEVEIEGERKAHLVDGVAMVKFIRWMEEQFRVESLKFKEVDKFNSLKFTEIDLADKLHEFRAMGEHFTDESFATIAGWKGNGAIVHYHAEPGECATIEGNGVLLLDSGGQYLEGTTDITRTLWIGDPTRIPAEVKHDYTLVLKGHIALAKARFPKGTRGNQLDVLAHQYMWAEGITYGHGTGHGVGHFMGCHEGPANIRTDNNTNPIQLGNIFSDEPGIYRANEYGIRIENLIVTVQDAQCTMHDYRGTGETFYQFEVLTRCPYDTRLIDFSILTDSEREWINAYHALVYKDLAPLLNTEEAQWLKEQCKELC